MFAAALDWAFRAFHPSNDHNSVGFRRDGSVISVSTPCARSLFQGNGEIDPERARALSAGIHSERATPGEKPGDHGRGAATGSTLPGCRLATALSRRP